MTFLLISSPDLDERSTNREHPENGYGVLFAFIAASSDREKTNKNVI
jgi:hypothetical protein